MNYSIVFSSVSSLSGPQSFHDYRFNEVPVNFAIKGTSTGTASVRIYDPGGTFSMSLPSGSHNFDFSPMIKVSNLSLQFLSGNSTTVFLVIGIP